MVGKTVFLHSNAAEFVAEINKMYDEHLGEMQTNGYAHFGKVNGFIEEQCYGIKMCWHYNCRRAHRSLVASARFRRKQTRQGMRLFLCVQAHEGRWLEFDDKSKTLFNHARKDYWRGVKPQDENV